MEDRYSVIIAGSSLAGTAAAFRLNKMGYSTCLIDKAVFPRPKPCGEGLSVQGVELLKSLGLAAELAGTPHQKLDSYVIHWGEKSAVVPYVLGGLPGASAEGSAIGIRREHLDLMLVNRCKKLPLVRLIEGEPVTSIEKSDGGFRVAASDHELFAEKLIIADGGLSPVSQMIGAAPIGKGVPKNSAMTAVYSGQWSLPHSSVDVFIYPGFRLFITPVGPNEASAALLSSPRAARKLAAQAYRDEIIEAALNKLGFTPAAVLCRGGRSNTGFRRRPEVFNGAYLAGDAVEQLDPVGGMGMTHALISGMLAADAVSSELSGRLTHAQAAEQYKAERQRSVLPLRGFTRLVHHGFQLSEHLPAVRSLLGSQAGIAASREVNKMERRSILLGFASSCIINAAGMIK